MEPLLTVHQEDRIPWQLIRASRNIDFEQDPLNAVSDEPAMIHRALRERYRQYHRTWTIPRHGWEADGSFLLLFRADYHGSMAADIQLPPHTAALTYHRCVGILVDWQSAPRSRPAPWSWSKTYEKVSHSLHVFQYNKRILRLNLEGNEDAIRRIVEVSKALICRTAKDRPDEPVEVTAYSVEAIANFETLYGERNTGGGFYREQRNQEGQPVYRQVIEHVEALNG